MMIIKLRWKKAVQMEEIYNSTALSSQFEFASCPAMEWLKFWCSEADFSGFENFVLSSVMLN